MQITRPVYTGDVEESLAVLLHKVGISKPVILCDSNSYRHCRHKIGLPKAIVVEIPPGEENKNLGSVEKVWEMLLTAGKSGEICLINLGGGVICDLGGFAASVFRRGIPFIHIPTTLLAMADASIGGKTGVDFNNLKNYIGTFCQPLAILISDAFLESLDEHEIKSAWAEIIKTAAVADAELFEMLENKAGITVIIRKCAETKHKITSIDPYDRAERQILNFGHTIGHAFEAFMLEKKNPLRHGYAVASGMHVELKIAVAVGIIGPEEANRIHNITERLTSVSRDAELPLDELWKYLPADKKNRNGQEIIFSLPQVIGKARTGVAVQVDELMRMKNQGIL